MANNFNIPASDVPFTAAWLIARKSFFKNFLRGLVMVVLAFEVIARHVVKKERGLAGGVCFLEKPKPYNNNNIPYLYWKNSNDYAGGSYYTFDGGGTTVTLNTGRDYTFHLDMEHPQAPSPQSGATVPAGNVNLGWSKSGLRPNPIINHVVLIWNTLCHRVRSPKMQMF